MDDTRKQHIEHQLRNLRQHERQIAGYRLMLAIANDHDMEWEQERIPDCIEEWEAEAEECRETLLDLGYDPGVEPEAREADPNRLRQQVRNLGNRVAQ